MERRLTAILAADVVGYSRLMGANEIATLEALKKLREDLLEPCIADHHGRTFKLTGDGTLVEFPSVVSALECALEIQRDMRARNGPAAADGRIEFRIGIHLGDVIVDGEDLYGDGVNVASRIESVAEPGGIAVSSSVRENVGTKADVAFEDAGEQELKNIDVPVRVYNVVIGAAKARKAASKEAEDKPSIAVLPFTNMSGDPEQEYFSDGITEDIITDLSKVSGLFVLGRNTSFGYKGQSPDLTRVAAELGVKFVLEGSVRKAGSRVRITGQLIDGATGGHVWADRYDRELDDIFAIQDEITQAIVQQLNVRLLPGEQEAIAKPTTGNIEAYQLFLRGRELFHSSTRVRIRLARQLFAEAVELDPQFARAYAGIAHCDTRLSNWYGEKIAMADILAMADKAIALDPVLADAYTARGIAFSGAGRDEEAIAAFERALELDPASFDAHYFLGHHLIKTRRYERAAEVLLRATGINPEDVQSAALASMALRQSERIPEADDYARITIRRGETMLARQPENSRAAQMMFCAHAVLGERDKAVRLIEHALLIDPDDTHLLYNAACALVQLGDKDRAIDLLRRWVVRVGRDMHEWMRQDIDLDPLRDDQRFIDLLASLGSPGDKVPA